MPVKSKFNKSTLLLNLVILLFLLALFIYTLTTLFGTSYWLFDHLIFLFMLFIFICLSVNHIFKIRQVILEDDVLVLCDLRGNEKEKIAYTTIKKITEKETKEKTGSLNYLLTIELDNSSIKIAKELYSNYNELKNNLLTQSKQTLSPASEDIKISPQKVFRTMLIIMGIIAFFLFKENKANDIYNTVEFNYIQTEKPKINEEYSGKSTHYNILIKIKEYPDFTFKIDGDAYNLMKRERYLSSVKVGDTLAITIHKDDYETKITKTKQPGFWIKHGHFYEIEVLGLRKNNSRFLAQDEYAPKKIEIIGIKRFWFLAISGLVISLSLLIYYTYKNPYD